MAAGWLPILPYSGTPPLVRNHSLVLTEHPTASGPCDYVLFLAGQPIAIVEAKKRSTGAQNVLKQAQRYAQGLQGSPFDFSGYRTPFVYSTDGDKIWFQDFRDPLSRSREVTRFYSPAALSEMLAHDAATGSGGAGAGVSGGIVGVGHSLATRMHRSQDVESLTQSWKGNLMGSYLSPKDDGLPMRESGKWVAEKLDYLERYINIFETSMHQKQW